ncbi:MAG TPA: (p)ppGpp synthetase, partial [Arthrobacter bacterium]|nr:(p)ppGpp synthetase [Arthrobacter sp.]
MPSNWDSLDVSLRESVQESVEIYERVRPALKLVTRDVLHILRAMLKDTEVTPLFVTGRTKSVESFREKISRVEEPLEPGGPPVLKFPDPFRTLNDMVGVRVITKLPAENALVANIIKRQRQVFDCRGDREKDIGSIESGTYGYSSRHLILRTIQNEAVKDYQQAFNPDIPANGSYFFECQIRT